MLFSLVNKQPNSCPLNINADQAFHVVEFLGICAVKNQ